MAFGTLAKPEKAVKSKDHLAFIRQLPCIQCAIGLPYFFSMEGKYEAGPFTVSCVAMSVPFSR